MASTSSFSLTPCFFRATDFSVLCDLTARNFLPSFGFKKTTNFKGNQLLVGRSFKLNCLVDREMDVSTSALVDGVAECLNGVIEVLVISGRQIDAVNLGFAFELTGQFSPVPLLKSYLKEARKASSPVKSGNTSPTAQNEVNNRELSALKAVLRCIEEHKLEEQYPVDPLQKRVLQLEKAKADKKRATEAAKPQPKRPRANSVKYGSRVTNVATEKTFYPRVADRYPQYVYDRPYVYPGPADNHCPPLMGSATYTLSPSHGNYFGNGYQYQAPYLH